MLRQVTSKVLYTPTDWWLYENYLNNVDYTIIIETLTIERAK